MRLEIANDSGRKLVIDGRVGDRWRLMIVSPEGLRTSGLFTKHEIRTLSDFIEAQEFSAEILEGEDEAGADRGSEGLSC